MRIQAVFIPGVGVVCKYFQNVGCITLFVLSIGSCEQHEDYETLSKES